MMNSRKDFKGRKLRDGESYRSDGRYSYRYTDIRSGKRASIYANDLLELRNKEKQLEKDLEDQILTEGAIKKITLNDLFETYLETRELAESTRTNYINTWNNRVKEEIGNIKVVQLLPSHVKAFYAKLSRAGYSHSTIKVIHDMLYPALEMAVYDDMIRKNPSKNALGDFGRAPMRRMALSIDQQEQFLKYTRQHSIYQVYEPLLMIMIGTGLRCGELIGLTWNDVDMKKEIIRVDHQLTYRNYGDGCKFHVSTPKTEAGIRDILMTKVVKIAFEEQRKLNFMLGINRDFEIEGYKSFIFTAKTGRPLMPGAINSILYNIVEAFNQEEKSRAKKEHRKAQLLPKFSAHVLRHTACTRMAECRIDIKILQYIMGHANIDVTMQVYNHITDFSRVEKEISKLDLVAEL